MLNKIYLGLLAVSVIGMSVLTYFSYNWLQSIDKPANVAANFDSMASITWTFLWISSVILLVLANVLLWTNKSIWSLWVTFVFFCTFLLLNTLWVGELGFAYKRTNGLGAGTFSLLGIFGALLCVIVAIGIFFNQFLVLRLREKTVGDKQIETVEEIKAIDNDSNIIS